VHTVTRQPRKLRLGRFDLPHSWIIVGPEEALTVAPDTAQRYRTTAARLNFAVEHPGVIWDHISQIPLPAAKSIAAFDDADWSSAIAVVSYLAAGPIEATMVRQLAIPGVHTKWIEQNPSLVCAMIGVPADRSLGDPLTRLINHIGLKAKETPVHVALPCPRLRASAANLQRLQAPISVLNASTIRPDVVLIIENDEPGHTLTADIPGAAIIHGLGFGAPILADLHWIASASTVLYWGDIDRAGLSILASLRRAGMLRPPSLWTAQPWTSTRNSATTPKPKRQVSRSPMVSTRQKPPCINGLTPITKPTGATCSSSRNTSQSATCSRQSATSSAKKSTQKLRALPKVVDDLVQALPLLDEARARIGCRGEAVATLPGLPTPVHL
jgi:Uncharacterized protein conserved in bacteria C-term(DUF2220)/Uncharacterized protein conserved in bacteria N-term (DUF3322)